MAQAQQRIPKARNILTIKSVPKGFHATGRCRFLELPSELRIDIYERALIEPRKWDKRHHRTCSYYNPAATCEIPPFRFDYGRNDPYWKNEDVLVEMVQCHKTCLRRKAVTLLRTNKQIYDEASPIFWSNNTFCFEANGLVFQETFRHMPKWVKIKVQNLAFMDLDFPDYSAATFASGIQSILLSMWNLRDLEIPYNLLMGGLSVFTEVAKLPSLRRLRAALFKVDNSDARSTGTFFFGLSTICDLPIYPGMFGLSNCYSRIHDMDRFATVMKLIDDVRNRVRENRPSKREHAPYLIRVALPNGVKQQVKVWGLPTNCPAGIERCKRRAVIAARQQDKQRSSGSKDVRIVRDGEEEDFYRKDGRKAKHYRNEESEIDRAAEQGQKQKAKSKAIEAQHQSARDKSASKEATKDWLKGQKENHAKKEAARKRSKS